MITTRTRVFGALVAVVIAAGVIAGLGMGGTQGRLAATSYAAERAVTTDAVVSTDVVRGDRPDARRLLVAHGALGARLATQAGPGFVGTVTPPAPRFDGLSAPRRQLGRAPPAFL